MLLRELIAVYIFPKALLHDALVQHFKSEKMLLLKSPLAIPCEDSK